MKKKEEISQLLIESVELLNEGILSKFEEKRDKNVTIILDEIKSIIDKNEYKDYFINLMEILPGITKPGYVKLSLYGLDVLRDRTNKQDFSYSLYDGKYHQLYKNDKVKLSYDTLVNSIKTKYKLSKYL